MGVAMCDPADPKQVIKVGPFSEGYPTTDLNMRTEATAFTNYSSTYSYDWKGEIHSWEDNIYWGGVRPTIGTPTKDNPQPQKSENVFFTFSSLVTPGLKDTSGVFDDKFAFYESKRTAGRDVSLTPEGYLTELTGEDGKPASTWLPHSLWERCKSAGIKSGDCSKAKYDAYMRANTTAPTVKKIPFWEQEIWGIPKWCAAAIGCAVCCVCLMMLCVLLVKMKKRGKSAGQGAAPPSMLYPQMYYYPPMYNR